jgi:hypothetical protein
LERSCENPEGCRYICNREYLLRGGASKQESNSHQHQQQSINSCKQTFSYSSSSSSFSKNNFRNHNDTIAVLNAVFGISPALLSSTDVVSNTNNHFHNLLDQACVQLVSLGSNNEFDWEDSMISLLKTTNTPLSGISTFDCTLAGGVKPSPIVSRLISEDQNLFHFYPFCIGIADEEVDVFSVARSKQALLSTNRKSSSPSSQNQGAAISLAELDSLLKNEQQHKHQSSKKKRNNNNNVDDLAPFSSSFVRNFPGKRVSILKMDIESFEFVAVPRWLQVEMALAGKQQQKSSSSTMMFDFSSLPIMNVEQIQTEIHRRGHKNKKAAAFAGAMWLQWLLLNYHALGFLVVSNEKNHVDNCCFEAVMVHYRYYVASQSWSAASVSK